MLSIKRRAKSKTKIQTIHFKTDLTVILSYSETGIPYLVQLNLDIKGDPIGFQGDNVVDLKNKAPILINDEDNTQKEEFAIDRADYTHASYVSRYVGFRYFFQRIQI